MTVTRPVGSWFKSFSSLFCVLLLIAGTLLVGGHPGSVGPMVVAALACLALALTGHPVLRSMAFTGWVFVFVALAMFYPGAFGTWRGMDLKHLIVPLIQIIMFGMGTTLSLKDFGRILKMPGPVFVGMVLQFSVMPLVGLAIATAFGFEPEVAAGVILIGSVPGGVASNLMTYLARGDVALSVTMTSCSTLLSPVMTPLLMKVLAGRFVPIDFWEMMLSILNMVIVPTIAGLIAHRILYGPGRWVIRILPLVLVAAASALAAAITFVLNEDLMRSSLPSGLLGTILPLRNGVVLGFALIAAVAAAKLVVSVLLGRRENWMDKALPVVSMAGICLILGIIVARSREELLTVGLAIFAAAVLHNTLGYILGYWGARLLGLNETTARTVSIEVGLQNGGMASGLAITVLQSPSAALAPAIFGPWMNVSGSILATWWHRTPVRDEPLRSTPPENNTEVDPLDSNQQRRP